ncbi:DEAD/DEAH box helicase [Paenibacillus sp. IHBB 3054]|uniref:DEAD/DEAH box helicase n=1 Tax=Paenibacillus sp. IHBB 3054 TaxID=3425689 RepID=UPI003F669E02
MSREAESVTKYFRSAVAAQANTGLDFKNDTFFLIEPSQLLEGRIYSGVCEKVFVEANKDSNNEGHKLKKRSINVIVCMKTVKTIYEANAKIQEDIDELTGLFFVPAKLNDNGYLSFDSDNKKLPWFPREYLQPMIEPKLAIGSASDVDSYISDHVDQVQLIRTWADYLSFVKEFYEKITSSEFEDSSITNEEEHTQIELEKNMYLFIDNTVNSTFNIMRLYNHLLEDPQAKPLYDTFTSTSEAISEPLIPHSISNMQLHAGQMGGEHPLSPSQREAINHYNHMNNGEVLAVNGPPGTGKTTLLQSIVADTYVKRAILEEKPPLMVATSTNNQAVTNIIASFGNIKKILAASSLEERWIEGVHSFATYFPSGAKVNEAATQGYQFTNNKGEYFLSDIETETNINASKTKIIEHCGRLFNKVFNTVEDCRIALHQELLFFEESKRKLLVLCEESKQFHNPDIPINLQLDKLKEKINGFEEQIHRYQDRVSGWEAKYSKVPYLVRLFSRMIKKNLKRIQTEFRLFISTDELTFLNEYMSIEEIKEIYSLQIAELRSSSVTLKKDALFIEDWIKRYDDELKILREHGVILHDHESDIYKISMDTINELIDKKIRYREFWLAVHYFECRWASGEDELSEKQKGRNYDNVLIKFYNRLSMITPCLVMTFHTLPKQFLAYTGQKNIFLYNFIDLLIVDEAGQVSPEIAAGAFALAKKAVVVGDVYQIEPVWSINKSLDNTLALTSGLIQSVDGYSNLEELGLTSFGSSVMKVASKSCKYEKYDEKGLFLSEHRRCYDEIIDYCNKLVYRGNLIPMRGKGGNRKDHRLQAWPQMGFHQIETDRSKKQGASRYNHTEAAEIAEWLHQHFDVIRSAYPEDAENNLVGIITPFKSQVGYIRAALKKKMPQIWKKISVGTVHTFQGAERNIIILSTVYGVNDGCYFIDANKSLMNVAVSRAKDHFFVFGDTRCLKNNQSSASGLLKSVVQGSVNSLGIKS